MNDLSNDKLVLKSYFIKDFSTLINNDNDLNSIKIIHFNNKVNKKKTLKLALGNMEKALF